MANARKIIKNSKATLFMILMPKTGRLVSKIGKTAQCIAQATEAVIPSASQLNFARIRKAKINKTQQCCKKIVY